MALASVRAGRLVHHARFRPPPRLLPPVRTPSSRRAYGAITATATHAERQSARSGASRIRMATLAARAFKIGGVGSLTALILAGAFAVAPNPGPSAEILSDALATEVADPLDSLLPEAFAGSLRHLQLHSNADLLRSWLTYLLCESPALVRYGPRFLEWFKQTCDQIPIIGPLCWSVAQQLAKETFFHQYTGGATCEECLPTLDSLLAQGVGVLLAYSVEGSGDHHSHPTVSGVSKRHMDATREALFSAAAFGAAPASDGIVTDVKPTSVAIKVSGLVTDPSVLKRASEALAAASKTPWEDVEGELFPTVGENVPGGLRQSDARVLEDLTEQLSELCGIARANGVRMIADAEYTWLQPAIDRITQVLSSRHNRTADAASFPIVFHTFQAYLRSTPSRLAACLAAADADGFSTGVKLVRGAYLTSEPIHHRTEGGSGPLPTWSTKEETDRCYDDLAEQLVTRLAKEVKSAEHVVGHPEVALLIAGHNAKSVRMVLQRLRDEEELAENRGSRLAMADQLRGRLTFGQILGMADNLTTTLLELLTPSHSHGFRPGVDAPFVLKYVPFGSVGEVLPYLGRRAQENSAILQDGSGRGGAKEERRAVGREIRRRVRALVLG